MSNYYLSLGITAEELDTLKEAFNLYDVRNQGYITIGQFSHIISSLGIDCDPKQVAKMADMNNDNQIDFNEFVLTMFRYLPPHEPAPVCFKNDHIYTDKDIATDEEIMQWFQFFDKDHDGRISQNELEQVMIMFNSRLSKKEIKEMMFTADINRDGFIDYDEFKQLLPPL